MNLSDLLTRLDAAADDARLIFSTDDGPIGGGYHVTELKRSDVTGIDCGAQVSRWTEAALQLLDGESDADAEDEDGGEDGGGGHLRVARFRKILRTSLATVDRLGDAPLKVEFAIGNTGLGLYHIVDVSLTGESVRIALGDESAVCKPAQRSDPGDRASACCSGGTRAGACCT